MSYISTKHKPDYSLVAAIFILVLFGLIMLASSSSVVGYADYGESYYFLKHQLVFGFLPGLVLFFILSQINYKVWQKYASLIFILSLVLLVLVFVPGIGVEYQGAKSWLKLGELSVQPSEIAKLALLIFLAAWFSRSSSPQVKPGSHKDKIKDLCCGLLPFVLIVLLVAGLIVLQPDMGTMSVIVLIAGGIYFVAGAKLWHLFSLGVVGLGAVLLLMKIAPYRLQRLIVFLDPQVDPLGIGYHINQALLAIGSGGIFGLGLGHSRQKFEYLPEVAGDSIFAIIAEELGFILATLLVLCFVYFIFKTLKIAKSSNDNFARLFCAGLAIWVGGQVLLNIGAMLGLLPLTGIPLPLISFGGTALMSVLAGCGILINISRSSS